MKWADTDNLVYQIEINEIKSTKSAGGVGGYVPILQGEIVYMVARILVVFRDRAVPLLDLLISASEYVLNLLISSSEHVLGHE